MADAHGLTRRNLIGTTIALGGLAFSDWAFADGDKTGSPNPAQTSLHQDVELKASPRRIYDILLDAKEFSVVTGQPAEIEPKVGGAFTMFGGLIVGHNVELVPGRRIVQAWRPTHWDEGVYSTVTFKMQPHGTVTVVALDQTGFPAGDYDSLSSGWEEHYWDPLHKYLA